LIVKINNSEIDLIVIVSDIIQIPPCFLMSQFKDRFDSVQFLLKVEGKE